MKKKVFLTLLLIAAVVALAMVLLADKPQRSRVEKAVNQIISGDQDSDDAKLSEWPWTDKSVSYQKPFYVTFRPVVEIKPCYFDLCIKYANGHELQYYRQFEGMQGFLDWQKYEISPLGGALIYEVGQQYCKVFESQLGTLDYVDGSWCNRLITFNRTSRLYTFERFNQAGDQQLWLGLTGWDKPYLVSENFVSNSVEWVDLKKFTYQNSDGTTITFDLAAYQ